MKTLKLFGASDDLIEASGIKGCDEFDIIKDGPYICSFLVIADVGQLKIHALYDGSWSFCPALVDEDIPLPDWPTRILNSDENSYTTELQIDCPDNACLIRLKEAA